MLKLRLTALMTLLTFMIAGLHAQVTTDPDPVYDNSQNVVIYFHSDQGNRGLINLPESTPLYAHCGVITAESKDDTDWKYATKWLDNDDKYKLTYESKNLYSLKIGNLMEFYGITDPKEVIRKMIFVFRTADGKKEGKGPEGVDITVDVISTALDVTFTTDLTSTTITPKNPTVKFSLKANQTVEKMWITINKEEVSSSADTDLLEYSYTFTEEGKYNIIGNVEQDGETISRPISLIFVDAAEVKDYPGGTPRMGAVRNEDGTVTFCLAAPLKENVKLIGSWFNFDRDQGIPMYVQTVDEIPYFWTTVEGLEMNTPYMYYYYVDGDKRVGDPYARLVLDPYNDRYITEEAYPNLPKFPNLAGNVPVAIFRDDINDFNWTDDDFKPVAKKDLVIYELLFRDFTGTEGKADGNGTVRKALEKLPYLKALGINAIELLPINEFNGNVSWGYNPNFYFAPDKAYGTPDDYKEFINTCHENGIAVILDMVFNQTDWLHPWYQMYPVGSNPMYNADAPHAYSVLNDWNQGHTLVRQQWKDVVKYWMEEYHVDGYRFDLVKGLGDNKSYPNSGDSGTNQYNASRVANMRAIQEAMNEVNPDAYFINENLAGAKEENEMAETGMLNWANCNNAGCQFAMGYKSDSNLNRMFAKLDSRTVNSTVAYLESHDEQRLAYKQIKFGSSAVKNNHTVACRRLGSAAAQMILVPGAHMIWQFSEMGNAQNTKDNTGGNNVDPKIVNWNLLDDPDNNGLMEDYKSLISIRTSNPELFDVENGATFTMNCNASNWDKGRTILASTADKQLIAVINPNTSGELTVEVPFNSTKESDYVIASRSYATNPTFSVAEGTVTLPANSYVVITSTGMSGIEETLLPSENLVVRGEEGAVVIDNAPDAVSVYDLGGRLVGATAERTARISAAPGIYIVRSGNQACKTIVR